MNNRLPQINFIYNRYKTATASKPAAVEMRITYNYKQKYMSTGIMLYPNQWKNGKIINCPDIIQISNILNKLLTEVRQVLYDMIEEGNVDIFAIPNKLKALNEKKITFIDFCVQRAEIRKYGKKQDSQKRYDRFIKMFKLWGTIKDFADVKESNIIAYDRYLASKGLKTYSKWNNYHRFLNSFILDAIDAGYIRKNPYRWVNIAKNKSMSGIGKYLSPEEFTTIKKAKMPTESLERVKDLFIFQTYTCLSYSDLKHFSIKAIQDINGMRVYVNSRQKTSKPFTIPILSPAWKILMKYDGKLPIISNVKYNEYLKVVAQAAEIDKPISSHWARHTGATLLLNEGVDMKIVSKICGHSSTRITEQIYAKLLDETVVDAVKGLETKTSHIHMQEE